MNKKIEIETLFTGCIATVCYDLIRIRFFEGRIRLSAGLHPNSLHFSRIGSKSGKSKPGSATLHHRIKLRVKSKWSFGRKAKRSASAERRSQVELGWGSSEVKAGRDAFI